MPIFMKYPGVVGEATAVGHAGWIELGSFQLGGRSPANASSRQINRTLPTATEAMASKFQDRASGALIQASLFGQGREVIIDFVSEGPSPRTYMTYRLHEALLSGFSLSMFGCFGTGKPIETMTLNFANMDYETRAAPAAATN